MNPYPCVIFFIIGLIFSDYCSADILKIPEANANDSIPANVVKLLNSYPNILIGYKDNKVYFADSTFIRYNDGNVHKTREQLASHPDLKDQFIYNYPKGKISRPITFNYDPGRIRNDTFFKKMYGLSETEVKNNLTEIIWCPKLVGKKIRVTKINNVNKALEAVSKELDQHPELKKYISGIGGTFNWRNISGTNRISMHSFGMTIDINTSFSNYWQWDCHCTDENKKLTYQNKIPQIIIDIFEKNGFIWGGKWYHYDTMHFEYRPELL